MSEGGMVTLKFAFWRRSTRNFYRAKATGKWGLPATVIVHPASYHLSFRMSLSQFNDFALMAGGGMTHAEALCQCLPAGIGHYDKSRALILWNNCLDKQFLLDSDYLSTRSRRYCPIVGVQIL
jgi:hypothetical protein